MLSGTNMKQKVVFSFHTHDHEINFGIGFLSSALKLNGIETGLVIYREIDGKHKDTPESVVIKILEEAPSIVAFSVMTFNWHKLKKVISLLRKDSKVLIVVGGYHPILSPEEVLSCPGVDVVCIGEGEGPILSLAKQYDPGDPKKLPEIEGLVYKGESFLKGSLKKRWLIERLEDYPYLDYDLFESEGNTTLRQKHLGMLSPSGMFSIPLITGRGCPYRCSYCSNSSLIDFYGGPKKFVRSYSTDAAVEHIKGIVQRYKPEFFEFFDETFTLDKKWTIDFCMKYSKEVGLPYMIMSRIDILDDATVSVLAETGLKVILFGLECGDEEYRVNYLNRRMSNKSIIEGARLLKKYGVMIVTLNMFGMPFETKDTINETISLNEEIRPDAAIPFIYQPFPNTKLGTLALENNMVPPPSDGRWDYLSPALDTDDLSAVYVADIVEKFREKFGNQKIVQNLYNKLHSYVKE